MELNMTTTYELILTAEELKIIGLALAGKLKRNEDIALAGQLNRKILQHRARVHTEAICLVDRALEKLDSERNSPDGNP